MHGFTRLFARLEWTTLSHNAGAASAILAPLPGEIPLATSLAHGSGRHDVTLRWEELILHHHAAKSARQSMSSQPKTTKSKKGCFFDPKAFLATVGLTR